MNWKKSWKCFLNETDVKICSISVPHVQTSSSYLLLHMIKKQFSTNTHKTFAHPFHKFTHFMTLHDWKSFLVSSPTNVKNIHWETLLKWKVSVLTAGLKFLNICFKIDATAVLSKSSDTFIYIKSQSHVYAHARVSWRELEKGLNQQRFNFLWPMKKKATFLNLFDDNLIDVEQMLQKLNEFYTPRALSHS